MNRNKPLTITYHNVIPDSLFDGSCHLGVSHTESIFNKQIAYLTKRLPLNSRITPRWTLTFDDGYKNQLEIAAKILNRYNVKGVFFVSFKSFSTGKTLTIDNVLKWFSYAPTASYEQPTGPITLLNENRHEVSSSLYNYLLQNPASWETIEATLNELCKFEDLKIDPQMEHYRFTPFDENDIDTLIAQGHSIASHGWDHRPLGTLDKTAQLDDFQHSSKAAKQYCNSTLFSYPYGGTEEVSHISAQLCQDHGYTAAYMNTEFPPKWPEINHEYLLPRLSLPNTMHVPVIDAKLCGFEQWLKAVRHFILDGLSFLKSKT